jgi:ABC-type dipeptide/oligopeptide/nickel transport system permease subunit
MTISKEEYPTPADEVAPWEQDLERVGLVRRALRARKWYGADWWFVAISSVMVLVFLIIAFFPDPFAPYGPNEIVGSSFLAPGDTPPVPVLIVPQDSPVQTLQDLAVPPGTERPSIGVEQGLPTSVALREQAQTIDDQIKNEPEGLRLRVRIERYNSLEETLQAVVDGEVQAAVVQSNDFESVANEFPTLRSAESIMGETATAGGFWLGTNEIGQDVFSRLIWGAQVALLIGFSASIIALVLGVPLGLIAAFVGGSLDRYLSLLMDSLYAFPGLILAIAITAILGPSVFNIIVAIAVVYIPHCARPNFLCEGRNLRGSSAQYWGAPAGNFKTLYLPQCDPLRGDYLLSQCSRCDLDGCGIKLPGSWASPHDRRLGHRPGPWTAFYPVCLVADHLPRFCDHAGGAGIHIDG